MHPSAVGTVVLQAATAGEGLWFIIMLVIIVVALGAFYVYRERLF